MRVVCSLRTAVLACFTRFFDFLPAGLAGLAALINARRLGEVRRAELFAAWPGWVFTWLFCLGDILAILVTLAGLAIIGKFSLIGISIPFIWLFLGALLSLIA